MFFCLLQTILVGDSGVGKTSLLVQFDQGKFQAGSFSATVGIGFTVGLLSVILMILENRKVLISDGILTIPPLQ